MSDFEHLSEEGAELAACGDAERLRSIREDCWIDYPAATTVLATLNEFLSRPRTTRMPSVAIYADSGMGKTMLMQRFLAEHRSSSIGRQERNELRSCTCKWSAVRTRSASIASSWM